LFLLQIFVALFCAFAGTMGMPVIDELGLDEPVIHELGEQAAQPPQPQAAQPPKPQAAQPPKPQATYVPFDKKLYKQIDLSDEQAGSLEVFNGFTIPPSEEKEAYLKKPEILEAMLSVLPCSGKSGPSEIKEDKQGTGRYEVTSWLRGEGTVGIGKIIQGKCLNVRVKQGKTLTVYRAHESRVSAQQRSGNKCWTNPIFGDWYGYGNPTFMTKDEYREKYEICKSWQASFDYVQRFEIPAGTVLATGPGAKVDPAACGSTSEAYPDNLFNWQVYLDRSMAPSSTWLGYPFHSLNAASDVIQGEEWITTNNGKPVTNIQAKKDIAVINTAAQIEKGIQSAKLLNDLAVSGIKCGNVASKVKELAAVLAPAKEAPPKIPAAVPAAPAAASTLVNQNSGPPVSPPTASSAPQAKAQTDATAKLVADAKRSTALAAASARAIGSSSE